MMSENAVAQPAPPPTVPLAGRDYRDPATLTQWLKLLLILSLLLDLVAAVSGMAEFALLRSLQAGTFDGDFNAAATANDTRQQAIAIAQLALFVVTGIVFLTWIFRANRNARALGAQGMRFTPGWSVGWFFVPIMSLWRPFQVMREIWQASAEPGNWQAVKVPALLGWWWAMYLTNQILAQIGYRLSERIDSIGSALSASGVTTASNLSGMALDVLAFFLIAKIAANQIWQTKTAEVF
jgi:hypothetical protein